MRAPENSPWRRLDRAFRTVLTVSKEKLLTEEVKEKEQRAKARKKKHKKRG